MDSFDFVPDTALSDLPALGRQHRAEYARAAPFPSIALDDFFSPAVLRSVLSEFPDLKKTPDHCFDSPNEVKLASRGEYRFGPITRAFMHFLNSQPFLEFLTELTGIKALLADPYFEGGGCHEILPGGFLKVHADFDKHRATGMHRRLNVLIYLNEDWREQYGGQFELWNRDMTHCEKRVMPVFNRMVVFTTTDTSFHGHPDPLTCPTDRTRRSLALYYYTVDRPDSKPGARRPTQFVYRPDGDQMAQAYSQRWSQRISPATLWRELMPPILAKAVDRLLAK